MGGCISGGRDQSTGNAESSDPGSGHHGVTIGKNQPLKHEKIKWKSEVPLTDGQLRSKRDEFWDTAPAFEGRKEIWDALKAAAYAAETNDYALAQAIVDGANISLPNGTLTDCYDELGNRYQLPVYCLGTPTNMIEESSESDSTSEVQPVINGVEVILKLRLSTGNDRKLTVYSTDYILTAKRKLQTEEGVQVSRQRWFFGGRLLNDKMKIEEAKIPVGFVVQVVISSLEASTSAEG